MMTNDPEILDPGQGDRNAADEHNVGSGSPSLLSERADEAIPKAASVVDTSASDEQTFVAKHPAGDWFPRVSDKYSRTAMLLAAILCSVFVFLQMRPDLLFSSTTPSGGDMGAHVWGPAFMRDHLLTSGRLTGWTPDWYAGFPAYHFYMVVPALGILAVNTGFPFWFGIPLVVICLGFAYRVVTRFPNYKVLVWSLAGLASVLLLGVSYGAAFKLVSVSGLVGMPLAAYAAGRLTKCPTPIPAFMAFGTMFFLFDTNFSIYGGNIASTLAGEFAFSISLCLGFLAIGVAMAGMDSGRHHVGGAVLIALVALCHVIPMFFVVTALLVVTILDEAIPRWWIIAAGITMGLVPLSQAEGNGTLLFVASALTMVVVFAAIAAAEESVRDRMKWLIVSGPSAALLSAFWLVPFALRSDYFNDMGWERLNDVGPKLLTGPMKVALPLAALGVLLSFATRDRMGMLFSILALVSASSVANLADGRLWNARVLPFYYLSVYIVAALAVAQVFRFGAVTASNRLDLPDRRVLVGGTVAGLVATLALLSLPLRILPFDTLQADGTYRFLGITTTSKSFIPSWVAWNYSGYEEKNSFREYRDVVSTMDQLGGDNGCGRAMWEYSKDLDRYGTPMALMLLPHWTDGCIGSMEGLYFESSATTPFHFLNQSALSTSPSRAQRDLPYKAFNISRGIAQLQVMGVRYYMAQSDEAIASARSHRSLTEVAVAEPFTVFEVEGTGLVEGLEYEPVVALGPPQELAGLDASRFDVGWVSQAVAFYNDPSDFQALPAADGPVAWQRVSELLPGVGQAIEAAEVTNIKVGTDRISFDVDEIGKPVLVKISYFPNWKVDGADGPWQVGPNLMVVVPTERQVSMSYGQSSAEYLGYLLTLVGIAVLVLAFRRTNNVSSLVAGHDQSELLAAMSRRTTGEHLEDTPNRGAGLSGDVASSSQRVLSSGAVNLVDPSDSEQPELENGTEVNDETRDTTRPVLDADAELSNEPGSRLETGSDEESDPSET